MTKLDGNWACSGPADAARLGVTSGDRVRVTSPVGSVEIDAMVDDTPENEVFSVILAEALSVSRDTCPPFAEALWVS